MNYIRHTSMALLTLISFRGMAQAVLPDISVKNERGRIIVSWLNDYKIPVSHIHVQRSYDSLRQFSTIGSVINPGNLENGYLDDNPPYVRMYYRVLVSFENGQYLISGAFRPQAIKKAIPFRYFWEIQVTEKAEKSKEDTGKNEVPMSKQAPLDTGIKYLPIADSVSVLPRSIFINQNESTEIHLPEAEKRKFRIRFTDKDGKTVIEINEPKEDILFLEKVNFIRSGIYAYEITENGKPYEKGQIEIPKDSRKTAENKPK